MNKQQVYLAITRSGLPGLFTKGFLALHLSVEELQDPQAVAKRHGFEFVPTPPGGDTTFCLGYGQHYALVAGRVYGPWPDKGAAMAGLETEQRRAAARVT